MPRSNLIPISRDEKLRRLIKSRMSLCGYSSREQLAKDIKMPTSTLDLRMKQPQSWRLGEISRLTKTLDIPFAEIEEAIK